MAGKRTILIIFGTLALLAVLGVGGYRWHQAWQEEQFLTVPPETPGRDVIFRVEPGQIFTTIARNLKNKGPHNRHPPGSWGWQGEPTGTRPSAQGNSSSPRAGYPNRCSVELTTSAGIMKKVAIREGLTWWETAAKIEESGLGSHAELAPRRWPIPNCWAVTASKPAMQKGYLFPETYLLTPPR